jgi:hypothetical protein
LKEKDKIYPLTSISPIALKKFVFVSIVLASIYLFLDPKKGSEVPLYIGQRD